jgi:hypothetical protein
MAKRKTPSRMIKVPGLAKMTVKEARSLREQLNSKINELPKAKPPKYDGPKNSVLLPALESLAKDMFKSLSRSDYPKTGVVTQFGISESVHGCTISFSTHEGQGLHVGISFSEYGKDEDGETAMIVLPKDLLQKALNSVSKGLGMKPNDSWSSAVWISATFENCPNSLIDSYSNYIPFKEDKGFELFDTWFGQDLKKQA